MAEEGDSNPRCSDDEIVSTILEQASKDESERNDQWHYAWEAWGASEDGQKVHRAVFYFANKYNLDPDDLLMDVYVVLIDKVSQGEFDPKKRTLGTYANGIVRNRALQQIESRSKEKISDGVEEIRYSLVREVEEEVIEKEVNEWFSGELEALPEEKKLLLDLNGDNISSSEIAQQLNISDSACRKRQERLRNDLRSRGDHLFP